MADSFDHDIADEIIRQFGHAEGDRGNWEAQWEEIAQRILPSYSGSFYGRDTSLSRRGEKRTEEMIDATGALALTRFAAVMESMLTPRNSTWHRLVPSDPALLRNRNTRIWFDQTNALLFRYRYAPLANYASQQHETYLGLGAFGTGAMFVDALDRRQGKGLRYRGIHLGEIYFLENHQGIIDVALRRFELTARQAMKQFPEGLPGEVTDAAKDPVKSEKLFVFIHRVAPREDMDPGRKDVKGMRFASHYVSVTGKKVIREGGYNTFPYPISRYVVAPGELYGRSPAMLVLPSLKVLNEQKKTVLKQGHRVVDPILLAHDDGVIDAFSLKPGTVVPGGVNAEGRLMIQALPTGNLALAKEMMQEERAVINDAFLLTLFQILVDTPQMTATEVLERAREKGAFLSPTMGRQQSESQGPMIDRELDVLGTQGLLPEMPPLLRDAQGEYEVIYDSPLSRAQRAETASGFMRLVDWYREYGAISGDMSGLDWLDWDAAMPELADIQAVPASWIRDKEGVAQVRQSRAQAQQVQQMIEAAPAAAGVMKALPNAPA